VQVHQARDEELAAPVDMAKPLGVRSDPATDEGDVLAANHDHRTLDGRTTGPVHKGDVGDQQPFGFLRRRDLLQRHPYQAEGRDHDRTGADARN